MALQGSVGLSDVRKDPTSNTPDSPYTESSGDSFRSWLMAVVWDWEP
jgi:hypothetical protein